MAAKDSSGTCDGTFFPYEKMGYDTNAWTSRRLDSIKQWVALEKVHGANFSFTVHASRGEIGNARAARRTGFLKEGENFYNLKNNQRFLEVEGERARRLFGAVRDRHCSDAASVTVFGELFGGCYPHPEVAMVPNAVSIQREVRYCPDIRFMAYDVAVTHTDNSQEFLDYDVCMQLFASVGFLYSEPMKTGMLQDMLSLELGFETTLPAKFGLPPLVDEKNTAEGVVIKPLKNLVLDTSKGPQRVIFKRKADQFQERKWPRLASNSEGKPRQQVRGGGKKGNKKERRFEAKIELLKYEMSALVSEQRLVNAITKRGVPDSDAGWTELTGDLARDVLESVEDENGELWEECGGPSGELIEGLREECRELVATYKLQQSMADTTL